MIAVRHEVRKGAYYDSVVLMQLQRGLSGLPDVIDAGVVMATPANRDLLAASDLLPDVAAGPDDLLIVVKAESESAAAGALAQVDALLARRRAAGDQPFRPRSVEAAAKLLPEAGWVLVSVPGRFAASVARDALSLGRHVFLYSDNVPLEEEIALKHTARDKGLLVMGPDCGTALINGVGFGFANHVRRGPIGLVGASGTGLQAVTTHIHRLGAGITHAVGTGGRDLSAEVGGGTTLQALDVLARDSDTRVIAVVSKPPAPDVAARVLAAARATGKPVVIDFIGYPPPARQLGSLYFAATLSEVAELAVRLSLDQPSAGMGTNDTAAAGELNHRRWLRGLFAGGTLAYEVLLGLQGMLAPLYSNAPIRPEQRLPDPHRSQAHTIVDLGGDEFTVGRLHPMMDNDLRIRRLRQEAADPDVAIVLLDVVLGEGAHPDPAGELAPVIAQVKQARDVEVVVVLIGTEDDPQNLHMQIERLAQAGALVFRSATEAVAHVSGRVGRPAIDDGPRVALDRFRHEPLAAINVGLETFYGSLTAQGARAVHVEWRPPAGGNERLAAILARMKT